MRPRVVVATCRGGTDRDRIRTWEDRGPVSSLETGIGGGLPDAPDLIYGSSEVSQPCDSPLRGGTDGVQAASDVEVRAGRLACVTKSRDGYLASSLTSFVTIRRERPMTPTTPSRVIRLAEPHEASRLAELQNRSSTHWGYPPDFFDWAPEAYVIPQEYVRDNTVYVLEEDGRVVGFYAYTVEEGELLLDKLFVDIDRIGTGCGRALWLHAVETARKLGHDHFIIGSDPNAASFYEAMGAEWYAEKRTPRPDWTVQMFRYRLPSDQTEAVP